MVRSVVRCAPVVLAATGLLVVTSATVLGQTVPSRAEVRGEALILRAASLLRRGPGLTDRAVATVFGSTQVRGAGACTDGACPITYNGETVYARRSHLTYDRSTSGTPVGAQPANGTPPGQDGPRARLQRGDQGETVKRLQEALRREGYFVGDIDGNFGRATVAGVTAYQRAKRLKADGIAGRETLRMLGVG